MDETALQIIETAIAEGDARPETFALAVYSVYRDLDELRQCRVQLAKERSNDPELTYIVDIPLRSIVEDEFKVTDRLADLAWMTGRNDLSL